MVGARGGSAGCRDPEDAQRREAGRRLDISDIESRTWKRLLSRDQEGWGVLTRGAAEALFAREATFREGLAAEARSARAAADAEAAQEFHALWREGKTELRRQQPSPEPVQALTEGRPMPPPLYLQPGAVSLAPPRERSSTGEDSDGGAPSAQHAPVTQWQPCVEVPLELMSRAARLALRNLRPSLYLRSAGELELVARDATEAADWHKRPFAFAAALPHTATGQRRRPARLRRLHVAKSATMIPAAAGPPEKFCCPLPAVATAFSRAADAAEAAAPPPPEPRVAPDEASAAWWADKRLAEQREADSTAAATAARNRRRRVEWRTVRWEVMQREDLEAGEQLERGGLGRDLQRGLRRPSTADLALRQAIFEEQLAATQDTEQQRREELRRGWAAELRTHVAGYTGKVEWTRRHERLFRSEDQERTLFSIAGRRGLARLHDDCVAGAGGLRQRLLGRAGDALLRDAEAAMRATAAEALSWHAPRLSALRAQQLRYDRVYLARATAVDEREEEGRRELEAAQRAEAGLLRDAHCSLLLRASADLARAREQAAALRAALAGIGGEEAAARVRLRGRCLVCLNGIREDYLQGVFSRFRAGASTTDHRP